MSNVCYLLETHAHLQNLLIGFEKQQAAVSGQSMTPRQIIQHLLLKRFVCL